VFRRQPAASFPPLAKRFRRVRTLGPWLPYRALHRKPRSGCPRPPLLGFVRAERPFGHPYARLPSTGSTERPLPPTLPSASAPRVPPSKFSFRPRGFSPPRRFPPLGGSRACCIPLPVLGFAAFPVLTGFRSPPIRRPTTNGVPMHSPRRVSYPPKDSPRSQPHHVTVAVAPLPFPPTPLGSQLRLRCQSRPSEPLIRQDVGFEALLRARVRNALPTVASRAAPCPSMGFVPLQGPSRKTGALCSDLPRRRPTVPKDDRATTSSVPTPAALHSPRGVARAGSKSVPAAEAADGAPRMQRHPRALQPECACTWHQTSTGPEEPADREAPQTLREEGPAPRIGSAPTPKGW